MRFVKTLFVAAFSVAIITTASAAMADVNTFGKPVKLIRYSNIKLQRNQKSDLRWLSAKKMYFGALYINSGEDTGYAVRGYHSLQNARRAAKAGCRDSSRRNPELCQLYATVVPKSFNPKTMSASGLGRGAYVDFIKDYKRFQVKGRYGAFAIAGMADYGFAWGFATKADAVDAAMTQCQADVADEMTVFSKELRALFRKWGVHKCKVIHVSGP